jgi:primosomal protein N' (replication factor Y)
MSLHKNNNALQCHYCNYTQVILKHCPNCTDGILKNLRLGTAEVTSQLKEIFTTCVIQTFDRDNIKTNNQLKKVLKEFNDNKIDILVGTQMLSKGHDYHNVTLAVVLGIDSVLNMTTYRAREKALSLMLQIAGRSGRKGKGSVIVQTKNKEFFHHYLTQGDYEDFIKDELYKRKEIYPPFVRFCRVQFSNKNINLAKQELDKHISLVKQYNDIQLIGFGESNVFKVANKYRYEMLLKTKQIKTLLSFLHFIKKENISVDMDSLS